MKDDSHPRPESIADRFLHTVAQLGRFIPQEPVPDRVLSYGEAVGYLATNQPNAHGYVRAALLRREHPGGWLFWMMYLGENDEPVRDADTGRVLGRSVYACDCDEELHHLFADANLIVFD